MFHKKKKKKNNQKQDDFRLKTHQQKSLNHLMSLHSTKLESIGTLPHIDDTTLDNQPSLIFNTMQVQYSDVSNTVSLDSLPSMTFQKEDPHRKVDLGKYNSVFESYDPLPKKHEHDLMEIKTKTLPLQLDLSLGSPDIIQLLFYYSGSKSEKFILSDWKFLIQNRWNRFWGLHLTRAILFWVLSFSFMIFAVFFPTNRVLQIISLVLCCISLFYEILRFTSYCFFRVSV
jgi:hypothetical protein